MRKIILSVFGGLIIQGLIIILFLFLGSVFGAKGSEPAGLAERSLVAIFMLINPGLWLFAQAGTLQNPHPGPDLPLALGFNIAVYSVLVYVALTFSQSLRARTVKLKERDPGLK
jgi:hypothetical protein